MPLLGPRLTQSACEHSRLARSKVIPARELSSDESEQEASIDVVCECSRVRCTELIEVTRRQYEAVRSEPRRFIVVPRHEHTDTERVVERNSGFFVVEKLEHAAEIAVEHDPRS